MITMNQINMFIFLHYIEVEMNNGVTFIYITNALELTWSTTIATSLPEVIVVISDVSASGTYLVHTMWSLVCYKHGAVQNRIRTLKCYSTLTEDILHYMNVLTGAVCTCRV